MSREIEERIAGLVARQHGVLTRGQVLDAGLSGRVLEYRVSSGRYHLLHRGVYLALPFPLPHTRAMAAVLASGRGAVLSRENAADLLWQLRLAKVRDPVDVLTPGNCVQRPGIRAHRVDRLDREEWTRRENIPVTSPARTLLDLAAVLGERELEPVVARAEREGLSSRALGRQLARRAGHRGAARLRAVLQAEGGPALTRSEAEAIFLALVREAGLPPPECNVRIAGYELDFFWPAARVAVEIDGFRYHSSQRSFEGDRQRDAQLAAAGIHVVRLTWRQITVERVSTACQLWQILGQARERR